MPLLADRIGALVMALLSYRLPIGQEAAFQVSVAEVLEREGYAFEREYDLRSGLGRIDFYIAGLRLGVELKIKGSPSDVARQLLRYTRSAEIDALLLVTGRARLGAMPAVMGGKPLYVAAVWRGTL